MMMLAPAMVRATPVLDFSSGFAGSTSSLNFNGSAQIVGHTSQNHQRRISAGGQRLVEESGRYPQVQLPIHLPDYLTQLRLDLPSRFSAAGNTVTGYPYESLGYDPVSPSCGGEIRYLPEREHDRHLPEWRSIPGMTCRHRSTWLHRESICTADMSLVCPSCTMASRCIKRLLIPPLTASFTHNYTIDIPTTIDGVDAYVGFTGSTGSGLSIDTRISSPGRTRSRRRPTTWTSRAFPERMQVIPRNRVTNSAVVPVAGSEKMGGFAAAVLASLS